LCAVYYWCSTRAREDFLFWTRVPFNRTEIKFFNFLIFTTQPFYIVVARCRSRVLGVYFPCNIINSIIKYNIITHTFKRLGEDFIETSSVILNYMVTDTSRVIIMRVQNDLCVPLLKLFIMIYQLSRVRKYSHTNR